MSSTELVQREHIRSMVAAMHDQLPKEGETRSEDGFVLDIMESVLAAETVDAIFAAAESGGISGQDFVGRPFELSADGLDFVLTAELYRNQGAFPFYARMRVTDLDTGEVSNVTCGGKSVVTILYALKSKGFLDAGFGLVIAEIPTASGMVALTLKPYRKPEVKAKVKAK